MTFRAEVEMARDPGVHRAGRGKSGPKRCLNGLAVLRHPSLTPLSLTFPIFLLGMLIAVCSL